MKKNKKVLSGISAAAVFFGLAGCSSSNLPATPTDGNCNDWEWDYDDAVWECDDYDSHYYGHYYHGGTYYQSKSSLHKSSSFKSYKSSSVSKGFGSGSKSFGG